MDEDSMQLALIRKVRLRRILYDGSEPDYRDQVKRSKAWQEIGSELHVRADVAKETWDKLRRCFYNAINRRRNKQGEDIKKKHTWKFEEEMLFVLHCGSSRRSNITDEELFAVMDDFYERPFSEDPQASSVSIDDHSEPEAYNRNSSKPTPDKEHYSRSNAINVKKKPLHRNRQDETIPSHRSRQDGMNKTMPEDLDETEMFFLSLANATKTLPSLEQARVKLQVSQIVFQAQIDCNETGVHREPEHFSGNYITVKRDSYTDDEDMENIL